MTPEGPPPPGDERGAAPPAGATREGAPGAGATREDAPGAGATRERAPGAGATQPGAPRIPRSQRPLPEPMSRRNVIVFAVFIGVLYAAGSIGRGEVVPGLVGGVLASVLAYLVFTEVGNRQRRRIAARERRRGARDA